MALAQFLEITDSQPYCGSSSTFFQLSFESPKPLTPFVTTHPIGDTYFTYLSMNFCCSKVPCWSYSQPVTWSIVLNIFKWYYKQHIVTLLIQIISFNEKCLPGSCRLNRSSHCPRYWIQWSNLGLSEQLVISLTRWNSVTTFSHNYFSYFYEVFQPKTEAIRLLPLWTIIHIGLYTK